MRKFKVAQIPSSRAVKLNFQYSKLKPYAVFEFLIIINFEKKYNISAPEVRPFRKIR